MTDERKDQSEWVLLWSQSQGALHIEPVLDMLRTNRQACAIDACTDYVPLAFGTRDQCQIAADKARLTLHARRHNMIKPIDQGVR